jgi:hypothetical protein
MMHTSPLSFDRAPHRRSRIEGFSPSRRRHRFRLLACKAPHDSFVHFLRIKTPCSARMASAPPEWAPDNALLAQVAHMLKCATTPETGRQQEAMEALKRNSANPDFMLYLGFIYATASQLGVNIQRMAGLTLKTTIEQQYDKLDGGRQARVRQFALAHLSSPQADMRSTSANLIATILRTESTDISEWPQMTVAVSKLLEAADASQADGALLTLRMAAEDAGDGFPDPVLDRLIPHLTRFMQCPDARLRRLAAGTMEYLIYGIPDPVRKAMSAYLPVSNVTARVCLHVEPPALRAFRVDDTMKECLLSPSERL